MNSSINNPSQINKLKAEVANLQSNVAELQRRRDETSRKRRRKILLIAVALSIVVHLSFLAYLNQLRRGGPAGNPTEPLLIEFATLQDQELTKFDEPMFDDLHLELSAELDDMAEDAPSADLAVDATAANLEATNAGSMPTLGGSGDGTGDDTLGGGSAGTSFFGVSSRGSRFAYVVDVSGSMGQQRKIHIAMRELARSISELPDYAYFYVVLFSTDAQTPPMQSGWTRAKPNTVRNFIRWFGRVEPRGGTNPRPAFNSVFSLDERPDVIFFMTDGRITNFTADELPSTKSRGKNVVINTIAFGNPASQDLLRAIARQTGGVYRFVSSEGN